MGVPDFFFDASLFLPVTEVFFTAGFFFAAAGFFAVIIELFFTVSAAFAIRNSHHLMPFTSLYIPEKSPYMGNGYYRLL